MKNYIYISIIMLGFSISSIAQYKDINTKIIGEDEVPKQIIKTQRKEFTSGFVTQWKLHTK